MKPLRPLLFAAVLAALAATAAFAQKSSQVKGPPCPVAKAPVMRGFQLGMHLTEVKGALEDPSLFEARLSGGNSVGSRAVRIQGSELKGDNAEGVDDVDLIFVDDRLSFVKVNFNSGMRWDSATDFFKRVSEGLGLPVPAGDEAGRGSNQRNQKYVVECQTFSVTLAYSFGVSPSVAISDTLARKKVGERRENSNEGEIRTIKVAPGSRQPPPK